MDNLKNNQYFIKKIITDLEFIFKHTRYISEEEFSENELLQDSVMFRLIQISENIRKLTDDFREMHIDIPWLSIIGFRNRIVHEYGKVDLKIVYDTVKNDIPDLVEKLEILKKDL